MLAHIASLTIEEIVQVAHALARAGTDRIEVNLNNPHGHAHVNSMQSLARLDKVVSALRRQISALLAIKLSAAVPLILSDAVHTLVWNDIPVVMWLNTGTKGGPSQTRPFLRRR